MPSAFSGAAAGTDEIYTKVQLFDLTNGSGTDILAGSSAPSTVPGSYGQVQTTTDSTGGSSSNNDFPARSFFDIFVDIQVPVPNVGTVDLVNNAPLLVESTDLMSLPPTVLYTHNSSSTVPIYIVGGPDNGDLFGYIMLAAHGVGYNVNNPADVAMFNGQWSALGGGNVPEPSTWVMMLVGFSGIGYAAYRRSKGRLAACVIG